MIKFLPIADVVDDNPVSVRSGPVSGLSSSLAVRASHWTAAFASARALLSRLNTAFVHTPAHFEL